MEVPQQSQKKWFTREVVAVLVLEIVLHVLTTNRQEVSDLFALIDSDSSPISSLLVHSPDSNGVEVCVDIYRGKGVAPKFRDYHVPAALESVLWQKISDAGIHAEWEEPGRWSGFFRKFSTLLERSMAISALVLLVGWEFDLLSRRLRYGDVISTEIEKRFPSRP